MVVIFFFWGGGGDLLAVVDFKKMGHQSSFKCSGYV